MRITSGIYKGTPLDSPHSAATHPMGERERLALFNMIRPYLKNAAILDAYSGTGALGLEAFSNGAKSVVFVDNSPKTVRFLKQNLAKLPSQLAATVITKDIQNFHPDQSFNLIFADPPYDHFNSASIQALANFLAPQGIIVVSHPALPQPLELPNCTLLTSRRYAAANISIFQRQI